MTVPECELCHSSRVASLEVRTKLSYVVCDDCGHALLETGSPSLDDNFSTSQEKYFGNATMLLQSGLDPFEDEAMARRRALFGRFVACSASVLEVGPGAGSFMRWLIGQGHRVTAVEESPVLAKSLSVNAGADIRVGMFEKMDVDVASMDAFCSFHVIEHTPSPRDHMLQAARIVKLGGFAFIATPNATSWQQRLFPRLSPNFDSAHLRVFSAESLARLATETGWRVIRLETPEYSIAWLRVLSKFIRVLRKQDEEATAGAYGAGLSRRTRMLLRGFGFISWPLRRIQAMSSGGNEVFIVLQRFEDNTQKHIERLPPKFQE